MTLKLLHQLGQRHGVLAAGDTDGDLIPWLQTDGVLLNSLLPKSVTTAIAVSIAEGTGGLSGLTAAAVIITGVEGAILAPVFAKLLHITDPVAEGIAMGATSHAVGTSKAMEIGELQGAMSSIALCVCGIITSVIAGFFAV